MSASVSQPWLITGASGMLGFTVLPHLKALGYAMCSPTREQLNLALSPTAIQTQLTELSQAVDGFAGVLHLAAMTDVDGAEVDSELAYAVNTYGTAALADFARLNGLPLVAISTDYVFDGTKNAPYLPTDDPNPINHYGRSKWLGEQAVMRHAEAQLPWAILRVSWLYGLGRHNFVSWVMEQVALRQTPAGKDLPPLSIVDDWTGSPTWTGSVALGLGWLLPKLQGDTNKAFDASGIYHASDHGTVSKYDQACWIAQHLGVPADTIAQIIQPVSATTLTFDAQRPAHCPLTDPRYPQRDWQQAFGGYVQTLLNPTLDLRQIFLPVVRATPFTAAV